MPTRLAISIACSDALAVGEAAEEQQVVFGRLPEREVVGVDAVQHGADDVEAVEQARLLLRDGDERRLGIARPQLHFRRARRVMQRLDDRRRRTAA